LVCPDNIAYGKKAQKVKKTSQSRISQRQMDKSIFTVRFFFDIILRRLRLFGVKGRGADLIRWSARTSNPFGTLCVRCVRLTHAPANVFCFGFLFCRPVFLEKTKKARLFFFTLPDLAFFGQKTGLKKSEKSVNYEEDEKKWKELISC
jgi:hypothetical protein